MVLLTDLSMSVRTEKWNAVSLIPCINSETSAAVKMPADKSEISINLILKANKH